MIKPYYSAPDSSVTIYNTRCEDFLKSVETSSIGAVVTDPPYGTTSHSWDNRVREEVLQELFRVCSGYCTFFYANSRLGSLLQTVEKLGRNGWVLVWHKPNAMGCERRFCPDFVPIVCAFTDTLKFFGKDFMTYPIEKQEMVNHPTPKPVEVTQWLVEKTSNKNQLVLDPYMGSGTTCVACLLADRKCIGVEVSEKYCEMAARRVERVLKYPAIETRQGRRINSTIASKLGCHPSTPPRKKG